jgi:uncharacterized protein YyaL (SSP411 family)
MMNAIIAACSGVPVRWGWVSRLFFLKVVFMAVSSGVAADGSHSHGGSSGLVNPDGSWKYTNALVKESSPYLLQHAHNPVDWYPWGSEAFERARSMGKPIFLSVGYSTCYWCHVMERQVFENPGLATMLNERFVSIKVDREERPDVDDIYMSAVQVMTGRGGWPMSVFLTPPGAAGQDDPGLKPYWAGTYIPPVSGPGMPGFGEVVTALSDAWMEQREKVLMQAGHVAEAVQAHLGRSIDSGALTPGSIQAALGQLLRHYDHEDGGFGSAPKFPQPSNLVFLIRVYQANPDPDLWRAIAYTLERMARGGMYDQVGGGFHRYSTDGRWLVPHFEKMLYDNGQLVEAYLAAHEVRPDPQDPGLYSRVVRETCDYVLREMTDPTGAFWSAQDAEVDSREGLNYLWTPRQVRAALNEADLADLAVQMYGLDGGVNFQDPHHPDEPSSNVLFLPKRLDQLARDRGMALDRLLEARERINRVLLEARGHRKQPATDDKVLAGWNGIMIAAMARAGRVLNEPRYSDAAARAADAVLSRMGNGDDGLFRTMRLGRAKVGAFLEDYAYLIHGLIELHRGEVGRDEPNPRWLQAAERLARGVLRRFSARGEHGHGGGYYDTLEGQADLFIRAAGTYDGAIPSGNSQMVHNLLDLYEVTGDGRYRDTAVLDLRAASGSMAQLGSAMVHMQHALLRGLEVAPNDSMVSSARSEPGPVIEIDAVPGVLDLRSSRAAFTVTLRIPPGYHVNAHEPGDASVAPIKIECEGAPPGLEVEVEYPEGVLVRYPFADGLIAIHEGVVVIQGTLQLKTPGRGGSLSAARLVLHYQMCTADRCLQPASVVLPIELGGIGRE